MKRKNLKKKKIYFNNNNNNLFYKKMGPLPEQQQQYTTKFYLECIMFYYLRSVYTKYVVSMKQSSTGGTENARVPLSERKNLSLSLSLSFSFFYDTMTNCFTRTHTHALITRFTIINIYVSNPIFFLFLF